MCIESMNKGQGWKAWINFRWNKSCVAVAWTAFAQRHHLPFLLWVRNPGAVNTPSFKSVQIVRVFPQTLCPLPGCLWCPYPHSRHSSERQHQTTGFVFLFILTSTSHLENRTLNCKEMKTERILMHAHSSCRKHWFMLVILIKGHERHYQRVRRWVTCDNACLTSHKKGQVCPCQLAFRALCKFVLGGRKQISW